MDGFAAMSAVDAFFHVRILVGIITGLSMSRLLTGLARPVQHPEWKTVGFVHTAWAVYLLLTIVHFWWFELGLSKVDRWTFGLYLFVIAYGVLLFLICTILFPDRLDQYSNSEQYFFSRKAWSTACWRPSSWSMSATAHSKARRICTRWGLSIWCGKRR